MRDVIRDEVYIKYTPNTDVLHIAFPEPQPAISEQVAPGIWVRREIVDGGAGHKIVGITITEFSERCKVDVRR